VRRFAVYIDVDAAVECAGDRDAIELAKRLETAVRVALTFEGATPVVGEVHCHRGEHNERVLASDFGAATSSTPV